MLDEGARTAVPQNGSAVVFMIVRRPDGHPTGYPMTAIFRDGAIEITTYRAAAKARHLLADDRVCLVLPDDLRPGHGLAIQGRATPIAADGFVAATTAAPTVQAAIDVPDDVRSTVADRLRSDKRMVFRIAVTRVRSIGGEAADAPA